MTCSKCSAPLAVGDWPFCPHGSHRLSIQRDDVPGGFVVENAWREPRKFYSQSEYEKALAADGMELRPHYVPGSKHLSNWATMDPQTLENGRILVSRQAKAKNDPTVTLDTLTWANRTVTDGPWMAKAELVVDLD